MVFRHTYPLLTRAGTTSGKYWRNLFWWGLLHSIGGAVPCRGSARSRGAPGYERMVQIDEIVRLMLHRNRGSTLRLETTDGNAGRNISVRSRCGNTHVELVKSAALCG